MVVENIPALVSPVCGEEAIGPETAAGLKGMRGNGDGKAGLVSRVIVPVFDYALMISGDV
ncbi:hypothetical protein [Leisingera sp.]|uniref:hypothetical protein n=1 Tax=Leisingera sp. TaxID=1879318 RepID=UPI002B275102|nr:hypothetical protein [Leisingera sp.]